jgi:hypothetical protein
LLLAVALADDLTAAHEAATRFVEDGEEVVGIVPIEPAAGERVYLCAYQGTGDRRWLALDSAGAPVLERRVLRDAVSVAALCELAEESAGGGDVATLRLRLEELRETENPEGIADAETAAAELEAALEPEPRLASAAYLDAIGAASARLERALGDNGSPFAEAMKLGVGAAEELTAEVESGYKTALD